MNNLNKRIQATIQKRHDEKLSEYLEDYDKVGFAFAMITDRILNNDDRLNQFASLLAEDDSTALGDYLRKLIINNLYEDAAEEVAQAVEKDLNILRGYES